MFGDGTFGDLLVGGQRPKQWRHVFASVQSLYTMEQLPQFDVVVIDEFHHAEAATYRRLLDQLHPSELLGLTATPERSDGVDVRSFFDGRTAYELPLSDALDQDLLCPFHYFGIADNTDLTAIEWSRGAYDVTGLSELYTGNDGRARLVLKALGRQVTDTSRMRALGFCVSVAHAEYMARVFTQAGTPSRALSGQAALAERAQAAAALRHREIRCLFTVDLFMRASTCPMSTLCCCYGQRRARRCSCNSSDAGCGAHRARLFSQSWTGLRREAGLPTLPAGSNEDALLRRVVALPHVNDPERLALYTRLLAAVDGPSYDSLSPLDQALARMLFFTMWPNRGDFSSYDAGLAQLRAHPAVTAEIGELLAITTDRARQIPQPLDIPGVSLLSHASYRREEILAGVGWANWQRKPHGRATGVAWAPETGVDALLVTLRKEERDFSPTTRYRDYPLAANLFHWESQNNTSRDSPTGRRYLAGGSRVLLFVRETRYDDLGSAPYVCLGEARLVEHRGERPIAITWRLHRPMPSEVLQQGAVAAT